MEGHHLPESGPCKGAISMEMTSLENTEQKYCL